MPGKLLIFLLFIYEIGTPQVGPIASPTGD